MSFIAFKVSDYNHTAEREQYRNICNLLRKKYENCNEICVFVANYNIFDCELDGILIKSDAIIAIEFKNYGGEVKAVENGQWTLADGTIIKGGSRKSVYQQARLNHVAIKRGLKEGGILPAKLVKDIPSLIVFAQPISLQNNLSEKVKSWLNICDSNHFIEKVEDITTSNFDLSNEQIMELIPKLGLLDEFVDKRFSIDINILSKGVGTSGADVEYQEKVEDTPSSLKVASTAQATTPEDDEDPVKKGYRNFIIEQVLPNIGLTQDYHLMVVHYQDFVSIMKLPLPFASEYVAILQSKNASQYASIFRRIFSKEVVTFSEDVIGWGEGEFVFKEQPNSFKVKQPNNSLTAQNIVLSGNSNESFNGFVCKLPSWLDDCIFGELDAKYQPSYDRFSYNLDLNKDESRIYLGTYFPRSFAESLYIYDALFRDNGLLSIIASKPILKILDFGCGSGGEIFGLLQAIENHISQSIEIQIVGVDGNHNSLRLFERIASQYNSRGKNHIDVRIAPCYIESQSDLLDISEFIGSDFDFIITSKAIGEFERKKHIKENGYEFFANIFTPLLSDTGIMSILDVTIKDPNSGTFLPQRMNVGINHFLANHTLFKSIAPCSGMSSTGFCEYMCFFKKEIYISHSAKSKDISKFAVRIVTRKNLRVNDSVFQNLLSNHNCLYK